jgi:hypothetical protein
MPNLLVACVADHETDVITLRKFDTGNHIIYCRHVDCVPDVISKKAGLRLGSERVTALKFRTAIRQVKDHDKAYCVCTRVHSLCKVAHSAAL